MTKHVFHLLFPALLPAVLVMSCNRTSQQQQWPPHNRLYADATLKTLLDSEILGYEAVQREEQVDDSILPEPELFRLLLADTTRFIMSTRKLLPDEEKVFDERKFTVMQTRVATDAVVLIVNREVQNQYIPWAQLKAMCSGEVSTWEKLFPDGKQAGNLQVVFDNPSSSILRHVQDSLLGQAKPASFFYALHSPEEVIAHVEKNRNAIGLVSLSWISEHSDSTEGGFLGSIKVLAVENPELHEAFLPYQAYLATREYPLRRDVYLITVGHTAYFPFTGYITGERGQRVVLKLGILPATQPIRVVKVKPDFDKETN